MKQVKLTLGLPEAQALHWLLRHIGFQDAFNETPPHFAAAIRKERAYEIMHATAAVEEQLREAGAHGDGWMYRSDADDVAATAEEGRCSRAGIDP